MASPREEGTADRCLEHFIVLCPLMRLLCSWLQKLHKPNSVLTSHHFLHGWDGVDVRFVHCDVLALDLKVFSLLDLQDA